MKPVSQNWARLGPLSSCWPKANQALIGIEGNANQTPSFSSISEVPEPPYDERYPADSGLRAGSGSLDRYLNAYGEVNLTRIRKYLKPSEPDFLKKLGLLYGQWVLEDIEILLKKKNDTTGIESFLAIKGRKRGNDIDDFLITRRMASMRDAILPYTYDKHGEPFPITTICGEDDEDQHISQTRVLYITNTIDPRLVDRDPDYAWRYLGHWFNKFKANLIKKVGSVKVLRSWESTRKGWPHIHAIVSFSEYAWETIEHLSIRGKNKGKTTWRLRWEIESRVFRDCWPYGTVDILAITPGTVERSIENILWYIAKSLSDMDYRLVRTWPKKRLLTQSLMWYYGLRSYAVSRSFFDGVDDEPDRLDKTECITKTGQHSVFGKILSEIDPENACSFTLLGIVNRRDTEIRREDWSTAYKTEPKWIENVREPPSAEASAIMKAIHASETIKMRQARDMRERAREIRELFGGS